MKRLSILNKPTRIADLADLADKEYDGRWLLETEKLEAKRLRKFRQQMAA